jgi:predicted dehydrogenase
MTGLRWGILGTGRITPRIAVPLAGSSTNRVVAVASRDASRASEYAARYDIARSFGSYQALIDDSEVDAVYVALPNHLHPEWTIRALEAGKHVLSEKPMAQTVEDVDEIGAVARRTNRIAMEGFMYLHHPQTRRALEIVRAGDLGEIRLVQGAFTFVLTHPGDPRLEPTMGGGALWDVGGYPISLAHRVAGSPPDQASGFARHGPTGVDLTMVGQLHYPGGMLAQLFASFEAPDREHVEIVGSEATLIIDPAFLPNLDGRPTMLRVRRDDRVDEIEIPVTDQYLAEIENLAAAAMGEAEPAIPLAETRANVATAVALYRSAAGDGMVSIAEGAGGGR